MVINDVFKFQKSGSNRSGKKWYWTCGEKPYTDCSARAVTIVEEYPNPENEDEPIKRHRLVSVSTPQVNYIFKPAPSIIENNITDSLQIS